MDQRFFFENELFDQLNVEVEKSEKSDVNIDDISVPENFHDINSVESTRCDQKGLISENGLTGQVRGIKCRVCASVFGNEDALFRHFSFCQRYVALRRSDIEKEVEPALLNNDSFNPRPSRKRSNELHEHTMTDVSMLRTYPYQGHVHEQTVGKPNEFRAMSSLNMEPKKQKFQPRVDNCLPKSMTLHHAIPDSTFHTNPPTQILLNGPHERSKSVSVAAASSSRQSTDSLQIVQKLQRSLQLVDKRIPEISKRITEDKNAAHVIKLKLEIKRLSARRDKIKKYLYILGQTQTFHHRPLRQSKQMDEDRHPKIIQACSTTHLSKERSLENITGDHSKRSFFTTEIPFCQETGHTVQIRDRKQETQTNPNDAQSDVIDQCPVMPQYSASTTQLLHSQPSQIPISTIMGLGEFDGSKLPEKEEKLVIPLIQVNNINPTMLNNLRRSGMDMFIPTQGNTGLGIPIMKLVHNGITDQI